MNNAKLFSILVSFSCFGFTLASAQSSKSVNHCAELEHIATKVEKSIRAGVFENALAQLLPTKALLEDGAFIIGCEYVVEEVANAKLSIASIIRTEKRIEAAAKVCDLKKLDQQRAILKEHRLLEFSRAYGDIASARKRCETDKH